MFLLHRESVVIIIHENWIISKLDYAIFQSPLLLEFLELIAQRNECTFLLALGFTNLIKWLAFLTLAIIKMLYKIQLCQCCLSDEGKHWG
jgi:hypothetical protein